MKELVDKYYIEPEMMTVSSAQFEAKERMADDDLGKCSCTPWRTPSGSKECNRSHALSFQTRIKILYSSVTISQSGSTKSKILNDLIVIIKLFTKDNPAGCNIT